jgi:hypothetical protein
MANRLLCQRAALVSGATFALGMIGCAVKAWHAPEPGVIAAIYLAGVSAGIGLVARDRNEGPNAARALRVRSTGPATLLLAAILGAVTAAGGAALVAAAINDIEPLFLASLIGSLWMGTYPLHPILAQRVLEAEIQIGLDAVRVGRTVIPYSDIRSATADGRMLAIERSSGPRLARRLPNEAVTRTFAESIADRTKRVETGAGRIGREGRALEAWKRDLLSPDYRAAAISSEEAARILEAGGATPDQRIGAALILAKAGEQERIRTSAASCVEPATRSALERVADATLDEDALTRATARR